MRLLSEAEDFARLSLLAAGGLPHQQSLQHYFLEHGDQGRDEPD
jgi:hypothetical protein